MQRTRLPAIATVLLGIGIALNSVLGPLVLGVIRIRESAAMETQLLGGELTSLFIAAPLAIVTGILWWCGSRLAPLLAVGPAGFALYMYVQFVLVPDYARYAGNNEYWFPFYLALVLLGWTITVRACRQIAAAPPPMTRRLARTLGALLVGMNVAIAAAWAASIAAIYRGLAPAGYIEHPTAFWLIRLMDLGFVIPLAVIVGVGLMRGATWAVAGAFAYTGTQTLLACAVSGMAIRMWIRDDPEVTAPLLLVSTIGAAAFVICYVALLRGTRTTLSRPTTWDEVGVASVR